MMTFGIAALILAIACTNLSGLMLARTTARGHEMAVRLALGASRWRVSRQLMTEGLLLAAIGGAGGFLCAVWASKGLTAVIFEEYMVTVAFDPAPDRRAIAFTMATALLFGLLLTVLPAWQATREQPLGLQQRTPDGDVRHRRQVAGGGSSRALAGAADRGRPLRQNAANHPVGSLRPDARGGRGGVSLPSPRRLHARRQRRLLPETIEKLLAIPGVERASVSLDKPAGGRTGIAERVTRASEPVTATNGVASIVTAVSPDFFGVLGITVQQGRDFSWSDTSRARKVAVVSDALARRLFGSEPAVGRHVRIGLAAARQDLEIVGVVSNARLYNLKDTRLDAIYTAALQDPDVNAKCFVLRGTGISFDEIRRAVDSGGIEFIENLRTLDYIIDRALLRERLVAALATFFGIVGALLAATGVFALMSYTVEQRRREIGIRMALGAAPARLVGAVVREGTQTTLAGVVVGLAAALLTARVLEAFLFGVTPRDPVTLTIASLVLLGVSVVACLIPAIRAARVDPLVALRSE